MDIERRYCQNTEIRVNNDDGKKRLKGRAAVFNSLSQDLGGFKEKIDHGAFTNTLKSADIRALWNHDPSYILGRTKNRTLSLEEDAYGLNVEILPPDTQWARDFTESINRGDVTQMSFGFKVISDRWEKKEDKNIRILEEIELYDVSPVTFPAYLETNIEARSSWSLSDVEFNTILKILTKKERNIDLDDNDYDNIKISILKLNLFPDDKVKNMFNDKTTWMETLNKRLNNLLPANEDDLIPYKFASINILRKKLDNRIKDLTLYQN